VKGRALVTGADGFVGSHLVNRLLDDGWEVQATLRGKAHRLPSHPNLTNYLTDLRNPLRWAEKVDVIFSLAATANPERAKANPIRAYENDVAIMANVLAKGREWDARVLHLSTNEVYGQRNVPPLAPQNVYAAGKACQEMVCHAAGDVSITIVVTQSLFGERQQPNKLIPTAMRCLLAGKPVPLQGNREWAERPFMHVANLTRALMMALEHPQAQRLHVASDQSVANREVVGHLADALGVHAEIELIPLGREGHELKALPLHSNLPGWEVTYPLDAALRDLAKWYRDHMVWL
jgi:nucleoside-diphosphate-sugar epimerase